jgi:hypothetical protein
MSFEPGMMMQVILALTQGGDAEYVDYVKDMSMGIPLKGRGGRDPRDGDG